MSLRLRVYGKNDKWFQIFGNNEFPNEFKDFLKDNNISVDLDGWFEGEVKTEDFISWYDNYIRNIYDEIHKEGKEIVNLSFWYNEGEDISPLMFYDKLFFAMDYSAVLQLYFLIQFLKEEGIANVNCGSINVKQKYVKLAGK